MSKLIQPNYFQVETPNPLDDRFARADQASREAIAFKWVGMQVFQEDTQEVWLLTSTGPDVWTQISGSASGHVIQGVGIPTPNQPNLNFLVGMVVTDNPGNSSTDIALDIDGGIEP